MIPGLAWHHVHLFLPDRKSAAEWHAAHTPAWLGWSNDISDTLHCGGNQLKIESRRTSTKAPLDAKLEGIGIMVHELKNYVKYWKEGGGSVISETDTAAKLADPWGTPCEAVPGPTDGYSHINIAAKDPVKLLAWYEETFGGTQSTCNWDSHRQVLQFGTMAIVFSQETQIASDDTERPLDHFCWVTTDIDLSFKRLQEKGVNVTVEPRPLRRVRIAYAEDPSGIWFELLEYPKYRA